MRVGRVGWIAVLVTGAALALGVGFAVAQSDDDGEGRPCTSETECSANMYCERADTPNARGTCRRRPDVGGGSEVSARRRADLTPAEQLAEAQRIQERGAALSRRVAGMLDEARRENDVTRVTCLDDKLTQINAHLRTLASRLESLQEASQLGDEGRRNHEFTVITVLGQNMTELDRAANECIGQDLFETGTTRVTTTIDPSVPDEDPGVVPVAPVPDVPFIPPPATDGSDGP